MIRLEQRLRGDPVTALLQALQGPLGCVGSIRFPVAERDEPEGRVLEALASSGKRLVASVALGFPPETAEGAATSRY